MEAFGQWEPFSCERMCLFGHKEGITGFKDVVAGVWDLYIDINMGLASSLVS
jgi:hypothetical protein